MVLKSYEHVGRFLVDFDARTGEDVPGVLVDCRWNDATLSVPRRVPIAVIHSREALRNLTILFTPMPNQAARRRRDATRAPEALADRAYKNTQAPPQGDSNLVINALSIFSAAPATRRRRAQAVPAEAAARAPAAAPRPRRRRLEPWNHAPPQG